MTARYALIVDENGERLTKHPKGDWVPHVVYERLRQRLKDVYTKDSIKTREINALTQEIRSLRRWRLPYPTDRDGWICSLCGGWNVPKDRVCIHDHSDRAHTFEWLLTHRCPPDVECRQCNPTKEDHG